MGLDSYLDLKAEKAFSTWEYREKIRPDVLLLKAYPNHPKFSQDTFWSPEIKDGYKMKWHQMGNGKVQVRLPVGLLGEAFLCEAYVKLDPKKEARMVARFKTHFQLIRLGRYTERGRLT